MRDRTRGENGRLSNRYSRRRFIAAAGAASTIALAGCGGGGGGDGGDGSDGGDSGGDGGDGSSDGGGSSDGSASAPSKPDKLIVRAWGGAWQENLNEFIAKPFTEDTGITVEFDNTTEEKMQGKIRTAINQDRNPPVNVNWSIAPSTYRSFKADLMTPLDPSVVSNVEGLLGAAKPESEDPAWPFVNLYSYTYALTYNTDEVSSEPTSWSVWWNDEWENSIGLYPGGDGVTPVIAKMTGTDLGGDMPEVWEKYRQLKPNVGVVGDDSTLTQNLRQGEIAMSVMLPANIVNARDEGAPVDFTIPEEGARASRDTMWIPKNQDESHTYWGQQFINYAASSEHIGGWCRNLGVAPLHPDASVPDWMRESVAFPTSEDQFNQMITVPLDTVVEHGSQWASKFQEIIQA